MDNEASQETPTHTDQPNSLTRQERYQQTVQELYMLANAACEEITRFQPELLIVLAHGGWGALWAVQALWESTYSTPLPPVLVTNLGREKIDRYAKIRSSVPCVEIYPFVADYAGVFETGYFLAWLTRQTDWQDAMRSQVMNALDGKIPERLLVLDDTTWEGGTYRLVLGLLRDIFPNCATHMLAGDLLDWRAYIPGPWLIEHGLDPDAEGVKKAAGAAYHIAPGTEDVDDGSALEWCYITAKSKRFVELSEVLPVDEWLKLPGWAEQTIGSGVLDCLQRSCPKEDEYERVVSLRLHPDELVVKLAWLAGKVTRRAAAAALNISPAEAGELLDHLVCRDVLLPQGKAGGSCYILPPTATVPLKQRPKKPLLHAYWVDTLKLMVGDPINMWDEGCAQQQIDWLLLQGIRCWINLDGREGVCESDDYEQVLSERAGEFGVKTVYLSIPMAPYRTPTKNQIRAVLAAVRRSLEQNQPVYLHGRWDTVPEAVAGCYLVMNGASGRQALEELIVLRKDTYQPWRRIPANKQLRNLIQRFRYCEI